jgi:hypothetical protein
MQFAAELRRLQDAQVHVARGYTNFGHYLEDTFEGLSYINGMQIARQGKVLLVLEARERIDLKDPKSLPGTSGVRDLCVILNKYDEETMLKVYDRAAEHGKVISRTVQAAIMEHVDQIAPPPQLELTTSTEKDDVEDDDDGYNEEHADLIDKLGTLEDYLGDVRDALLADKRGKAKRILGEITEELNTIQEEVRGL